MKYLCIYTLLLLATFCADTKGHSWLACVDYTEKNGAYWDPNKCRGFARDSASFSDKNSFGQDRGFNHQPGMDGKACKTELTAGSYSSAYPKAVYYPGQQVILVHPMKNHGASAICTNVHIEDHGNRVYHGMAWNGMEAVDTNKPYSYYRPFLVADLGVSLYGRDLTEPDKYPKPGYQNAPAFCENTDKAMGTYSFEVPKTFKPGQYTFVWRWSFNSPSDLYTTCFDVVIANNKAERNQLLMENGFTDLSAPCGGILSNNQAASTNCNGGNSGSGNDVRPTSRPTDTTRRTTPRRTKPRQTTTQAPPENSALINLYQMAGEIDLGQPDKGAESVTARISFNCKVEARFWNARLVSKGASGTMAANRFDLLQESVEQIRSGKIYFHATFLEPCDINRNPPVAIIV